MNRNTEKKLKRRKTCTNTKHEIFPIQIQSEIVRFQTHTETQNSVLELIV